MNLCSTNHDEIAYVGRDCPACAALEAKDETIAELKRDLDSAKDEVKSYEETVSELEAKLNDPVVHAIHRAQASQAA